MSVLEVKNLHVSIEDKEVLKGVDLTTNTGEIHAIIGPNRAGKSTLSTAVMGNPNYEVTKGEILSDGVSVLDLEVDERARLDLLLIMRYPNEILRITNAEFIRATINVERDEDNKMSVMQFLKKLNNKMELSNMSGEIVERYLNGGFSGSEKKRNETLQLLMLEPTFAILNGIDSGSGTDVLKIISKRVNEMRGENLGTLITTRYQRLLNYITPDAVHIMMEGHVVETGGANLARRLKTEGCAGINQELGIDHKEEA